MILSSVGAKYLKHIAAQVKIYRQNMPPLRGLNLFGAGFYKDVTPTALKNGIILTHVAKAQVVTTDAIIKKVFNAVPGP